MVICREDNPRLTDPLNTLAEILDDCSDELSKSGDGCRRCSCRRDCEDFWADVEPKRDNRLSVIEFMEYAIRFQAIRGRRQLLLPFEGKDYPEYGSKVDWEE